MRYYRVFPREDIKQIMAIFTTAKEYMAAHGNKTQWGDGYPGEVLLLLMGFALLAYVCSFFFYKVFAKYIDEEPVGEDDPLYGSRE